MFLGIDIGTSGVKAVVLDEHGAVVGQGTAALTVQRPHPLWSEQDPEAWWQATTAAVRAIDPAVRRAVRGIGLAGQMHGATLLGADDQVLRPGILWNDGRSHAECAELEAKAPDLHQIAGNLARLQAEGQGIDGIAAASDMIALATMAELVASGRSVPGDVAVTGFDDLPLAERAIPRLTTIRQDLEAGAKAMVAALFDRIDGRPAPGLEMPPRLIVRDSA